MNEEQARKILGDTIQKNEDLFNPGHYICWEKNNVLRNDAITLDDRFTVEELKAIIWWMENKK